MTKLIQSIATIKATVNNKFLTEEECNSSIGKITLLLEKIKQENGFIDLELSIEPIKSNKYFIMNPLMTHDIQISLEKNRKLNNMYCNQDCQPVAKLYSTTTSEIWLLIEIDKYGILHVFSDKGNGKPDFDYVDIEELEQRLKESGYPDIKRDKEWTPTATIEEYSDRAMELKSLSLAIIEIDKENASKD